MCGIWASAGRRFDRTRIEIVSHRGPDAVNWKDSLVQGIPVSIGHARLSITGRGPTGDQPMSAKGHSAWITFNGELYNHNELRLELLAVGFHFNSRSDTEVLLCAYLYWGEEALTRLRGMFAFVVVDEVRGELFAARDRYGIKPLYFCAQDDYVAFASEIKQLTNGSAGGRTLNVARAIDYIELGLTDHTDETLFAGIRQLRAGEAVRINIREFRKPRVFRWYQLPEDFTEPTECEASHRLRGFLEESVSAHLPPEVSCGIALSGGVDSATIATLGVRANADSLVTAISARFRGADNDESALTTITANAARLPVIWVDPEADDLLSHLTSLVWHLDEPFSGTSVFAQWKVFEAAKAAGMKVMLTGQGADELMGGYPHMSAVRKAELQARLDADCAGSIWERRSRERTIGPVDARQSYVHANLGESWDTSAPAKLLSGMRSLGDHCRYLLNTRSLPLLLRYEDRTSMAHGIETRVPFLDHRVAEFAISLGGKYKILGKQRKHVLRIAMSGDVPENILNRHKKIGFTSPEDQWLRGTLAPFLIEHALNTARLWSGLLDEEKVVHDCDRLAALSSEGLLALWRVACFGVWANVFGIHP